MSGNIDMAKNRLLQLPEPTDAQEPATKGYTDSFSKVVWKDASQSAMDDYGRTTFLNWTARDLTTRTSPNAKLAIIQLVIEADVVGTGLTSFIGIRKHGTTPVYYPLLRLDKAGTSVGVYNHQVVIVGLDNDRFIDFTILPGTGWKLESHIAVLGYIE